MEVNTILFDFFGTLVAYTPGDYFHKQRKKTYTFLLEHGYNERYHTWQERITKTYTKQTVDITTSIDHGKIKPNKTIFADTLALLQIKPTQTIFIGDNYEDDYQGGTGAGIQTYLLDPHKHYLHLGKNRIEQISDIEKHL